MGFEENIEFGFNCYCGSLKPNSLQRAWYYWRCGLIGVDVIFLEDVVDWGGRFWGLTYAQAFYAQWVRTLPAACESRWWIQLLIQRHVCLYTAMAHHDDNRQIIWKCKTPNWLFSFIRLAMVISFPNNRNPT